MAPSRRVGDTCSTTRSASAWSRRRSTSTCVSARPRRRARRARTLPIDSTGASDRDRAAATRRRSSRIELVRVDPVRQRTATVCRRRHRVGDEPCGRSRARPPAARSSGRRRADVLVPSRVVDRDVGTRRAADVGRRPLMTSTFLSPSASINASAFGYVRKTICSSAGPHRASEHVELDGVGGGRDDVPRAVGDAELARRRAEVGDASRHVRGHDVEQESRRGVNRSST